MKRILSALLCAAVCLTGFSGCGTPAKESSRLKLLASFYPIAIMALNITDGGRRGRGRKHGPAADRLPA